MSERCLSVFAFGAYQINPNAMESARALQGRAAITKPYFDSAYRLSAMCRATRIPARFATIDPIAKTKRLS